MRIVLVRLSALGDIVHTWPLAEALRAADPSIHLTWVIERVLRPLVEGHPAIDSVIPTETARWRKHPFDATTRAEIAGLKTRFHELQPDLTIDPQGTFKSAIVTRWTGAGQRVGLSRPWRRELIAGLAYSKTIAGAPAGAHVVDTNLAMTRAIGALPPVGRLPDGSWLAARLADREITGGWKKPYAVVLPGVGGGHKKIPTQTLAEVSDGVADHGLEVVALWGPGERNRAAEVIAAAGSRVRLAPATDIEEMAAILSTASLVIGGDTGPVHLAASFGIPTVGVFLASDWHRNGPLGARAIAVSGAEEAQRRPSGTARVRPKRAVAAREILDAARSILVV